MLGHVLRLREALAASVTGIGFFSRVDAAMDGQIAGRVKPLLALFTFVRLLPCVAADMSAQVIFARKRLVAESTGKGLLPRVRQGVLV